MRIRGIPWKEKRRKNERRMEKWERKVQGLPRAPTSLRRESALFFCFLSLFCLESKKSERRTEKSSRCREAPKKGAEKASLQDPPPTPSKKEQIYLKYQQGLFSIPAYSKREGEEEKRRERSHFISPTKASFNNHRFLTILDGKMPSNGRGHGTSAEDFKA